MDAVKEGWCDREDDKSLIFSLFSTQVSFVQYSDNAKTEFKLNAYQDKGIAMAALPYIRYRGGNTKTGLISCYRLQVQIQTSSCWSDTVFLWAGEALKHTYEKAFSLENGMRRNVPKVVVAITDGRSQDEVKKNAARLQHAGRCHTNTYHQNLLQHLHASVSQMSSLTNSCKQTAYRPNRSSWLSSELMKLCWIEFSIMFCIHFWMFLPL